MAVEDTATAMQQSAGGGVTPPVPADSPREDLPSLIDQLPVATYTRKLERHSPATYVSSQVEKMLGYQPPEFVENPYLWLSLIHAEDRQPVVAQYVRTAETLEPFRAEYRMNGRNGHVVWVQDEAVVVTDHTGRPLYWRGVVVDVTERKRAEEELKASHSVVQAVTEGTPDAMYVKDREGRFLMLNSAATRLIGRAREEVLGRRPDELYDAETAGRVTSQDQAIMATGATHTYEERLQTNGNDARCYLTTKGPFRNHRGEIVGVFGVSRDITDRRRSAEELTREREFLRALLDSITEGIVACDADGTLTLFNRAAREIHGIPATAVGPDEWAAHYALYRPDGHTPLRKEDIPLFRAHQGEDVRNVEMVIAPPGRPSRTLTVNGQAFYDDAGNQLGAVVAMHDVTERKALEERLSHQALHDALTGLPNRALFTDRLAHALTRVRAGGPTVGVLFMDLDNLKVVNDSLGHTVGDRLLVAVSQRLTACLRPVDTVARLGGDEFTILLEDIADVGEAIDVAERVAESLRMPFELAGRQVYLTASVGVALSVSGDDRADDLLRRADVAMYKAKNSGKAQYRLFNQTMDEEARSRLVVQNDLRKAVERGELRLHYQPTVLLDDSSRVVGMEALVRWQHPERGLLPPAEFLFLAEESDLIIDVERWVLEQACRQGRDWQESGTSAADWTVSVNLSTRQFQEGDLVTEVDKILRVTGLPAERLMLEITESVMMQDVESAVATVRGLKSLGVHLAIDDFGTGYSALSYLHHLQVDVLKIDRSFTAGLGETAQTRSIVQGIIRLAHALGLTVLAEGVETAEQATQLRVMGCDMAQGYHFARPLPADAAAPVAVPRQR